MNVETVTAFVAEHRQPADYLYLLLDPLADCDDDHPLSLASLTEAVEESLIARVLRPDLAHVPEACPALIQLAAPNIAVMEQLLKLSARYSAGDIGQNKRYVCGWLLSEQPPAVIAKHMVQRCRALSHGRDSTPAPWFEPIRLELLGASMHGGLGRILGPIRQWLCPLSWGHYRIYEGTNSDACLGIPDLSSDTQHTAPLVIDLLEIWRTTTQRPLWYAGAQWKGDSPLPPEAAVHAFRLIREARKQGLRTSADIIALCLHRLLIHPLLLQHSAIQEDVAAAAVGRQSLQSRFKTRSATQWQNIALSLPPAQSYS